MDEFDEDRAIADAEKQRILGKTLAEGMLRNIDDQNPLNKQRDLPEDMLNPEETMQESKRHQLRVHANRIIAQVEENERIRQESYRTLRGLGGRALGR